MRITDVRFLGAFMDPKLCPSGLPGVVFSGRSNVGKSSLLNKVTGRAIARTSKTPGRTRQLVYFEAKRDKGGPFYVIDLPGYGYARGPEHERNAFARAVRGLLADTSRVHAVLQLVDASVPWQESDLEMLQWLLESGRAFALVHTKSDRVKMGAMAARKQELRRLLPWREEIAILDTSVKDNAGIVGVRKWIAEEIAGPTRGDRASGDRRAGSSEGPGA